MITRIIADTFDRIGFTWKVGEKRIQPTENDVQEVLDEAVSVLYTRPEGQQLQVGGLIIEKRPYGHDVWVYVGNYPK